MNEQFKVNDICIGQNFTMGVHRNDMECEIIKGLQNKESRSVYTGRINTRARYKVRWADGSEFWLSPFHLRRKPPKQSDKEWAEGKVREITQDSVHVAGGAKHLIPEETA